MNGLVITMIVIAVIIVIIVLLLAVVTTSKAYKYQHTVDPITEKPEAKSDENSIADLDEEEIEEKEHIQDEERKDPS
ncbi:YtzI protein [Falsibacillus pallidus]|uniref:Tumor necrosis factor receptor superfamily member 19 n=1 Tax=Falsibacillus pallidus TaxID=493781 RepID=A0A370GL20_9BACI|nr:YtzI protein [Falsibacillus pallidus]RDI44367.1 tumor necrosis factor receptor superfamily member 19 [Falsibacillus pallidus]